MKRGRRKERITGLELLCFNVAARIGRNYTHIYISYREGMPIGVKVTLRGKEMYQFLDKLVEIVLPRLKEWHGLPMTSGDGNGNIGIGFPASALALFPEIEGSFDMYPKMTGFDVVFNTTAHTNAEGRLLLSGFNVPFKGAKTQAKK